jgi:hypothetical protein
MSAAAKRYRGKTLLRLPELSRPRKRPTGKPQIATALTDREPKTAVVKPIVFKQVIGVNGHGRKTVVTFWNKWIDCAAAR